MKEPRHVCEDSSDCLSRILDPDIDVAIWRRRIVPAIGKPFRKPRPDDIPNAVLRTTAATLADHLADNGILTRTRWDPIVADIASLARLFEKIVGKEGVRLRLEHPSDDGCRLFHTDGVRLRLVVTYLGPGTEWLAEDDLDRSGLGKRDNALVVKGENVIRRVPRYAVVALKGEKFTGVPHSGAVHRSPPIAAESIERFYVVIDDSDVDY